jgi:hypothetical protein
MPMAGAGAGAGANAALLLLLLLLPGVDKWGCSRGGGMALGRLARVKKAGTVAVRKAAKEGAGDAA